MNKTKNRTKQVVTTSTVAAWTLVAGNTLAGEGQSDQSPSGATSGLAASVPADQWQFGVSVPLWAIAIDGNLTVKGRQRDVSVSFDELKDHLDMAFALGLEAHKGKFGIFTSGNYLKFSGDYSGSGPGSGNASSELKLGILNAGLSYALVQTVGEHPFMLAGTLGLRYYYLSDDLTLRGPGGFVTLNGSDQWDLVDPVIGLRASQYLTPKFHLDVIGDVGGFNISYDTDMSWSAAGMATYDFTKWFSLSAGYAALNLDVKTGSGTGERGFDLLFNGPQIMAKFSF